MTTDFPAGTAAVVVYIQKLVPSALADGIAPFDLGAILFITQGHDGPGGQDVVLDLELDHSTGLAVVQSGIQASDKGRWYQSLRHIMYTDFPAASAAFSYIAYSSGSSSTLR